MPCITEFYNRICYPNKVKVIPLNIYEFLTPVPMAHFIIGYGIALCHGFVLSTNFYSIQDVVILMNVIMIRYRLKCYIRNFRLNKNPEYIIYIRLSSMPLLRTIVKPYMHSYMAFLFSLLVLASQIKSLKSFGYRQSVIIPGRRFYLTDSHQNLSPYYVTGFTDGEVTFQMSFNERAAYKTGINLLYSFAITLHKKDLDLLRKIKLFFGVGYIVPVGKDKVFYAVLSVKDLINVIIPHFDKYPLLTQKRADFVLFTSAIIFISQGEHIRGWGTNEGINQIVGIKASMNKGLSPTLIKDFDQQQVIPVKRPLIETQEIKYPSRLSSFTCFFYFFGFISINPKSQIKLGEDCLLVSIQKSHTKVGYRVSLLFQLTLHSRDNILFEIIKKHLTSEGFEKIKIFRQGINTGRSSENYKVYYTTNAANKGSSFSIKVSKKELSTLGYVKPEFINKILYSTLNIESKLNPYWITGFCDAESSFSIKVSKKSTSKSGWNVTPEFKIELHSRDTLLLRKIQSCWAT